MFREREREREKEREREGCLNSVGTYLPGTVLQGCSCLVVSQPICRHSVAEVQLFKLCHNLTAGHCVAGVQLLKRCRNLSASTVLQGMQLFKWCGNLSAGTVLQGCSCLSGVETYLPALCCRCAAV